MDKAVLDKVQRWWLSMFGDTAELKKQHIHPAPSAYRAQLKRCATVDSIMLTEGFRALWLSLPDVFLEKASAQDLESMATVAGVLVYVTENSAWRLASAAGRAKDDKSTVSELRFYQLLNARDTSEFLRRLRRIVQQLKGAMSVTELAQDILRWFDEKTESRPRSADQRLAVKWAMDYFQAMKLK